MSTDDVANALRERVWVTKVDKSVDPPAVVEEIFIENGRRKRMHLAHRTLTWSPLNSTGRVVHRMNGVVEDEPRRNRVAIVGAGLGREKAPLDDPTWAVWALNLIPPTDTQGRVRCDRWFDLHELHAQTDDDLRWFSLCPVPLYLVPSAFASNGAVVSDLPGGACTVHDVPNAVRFPLERVESRFGGYWACTFAYQIALALAEGYREIGLYGVDLAYGTARERTVEWACVSWWCGLAEGIGAAIHLPYDTLMGRHLGRCRYGVEYSAEKSIVEDYLKICAVYDRARAISDEPESGMGG